MSSSAAEKEQALLKKRLEAQLKLPHNQTCADCPSRLPRWASTNLGVFICTNCSGIHRGLGVHISKVRSCALDKWTTELVMTMENIGNKRANEHWEHDVPASVARPREGDMRALDRWIRDKYELRQYAPRNCPPPDGKAAPLAAPVAAAAPPVPPKPATFAQPRAVQPSSAALKPPAAAAPPPAAPAFDLLGGMDAPAPAATAAWDAFAEPPKASDDWMADFVVAAPAAVAPAPAAAAWDAFATAPAIPAPPPPQHGNILDLFGAPPVATGVASSAPLDLAGQLAGMQVHGGGVPTLAPPVLPPKPSKPPSNQDLLSL